MRAVLSARRLRPSLLLVAVPGSSHLPWLASSLGGAVGAAVGGIVFVGGFRAVRAVRFRVPCVLVLFV